MKDREPWLAALVGGVIFGALIFLGSAWAQKL
jgi:hypothetical protein